MSQLQKLTENAKQISKPKSKKRNLASKPNPPSKKPRLSGIDSKLERVNRYLKTHAPWENGYKLSPENVS